MNKVYRRKNTAVDIAKAIKYFLLSSYFCILISVFLILAPQASAFTMSDALYILQMGNLNMSAGKPSNLNFSLNNTLGETGSGLYSGTNYKVRAGFQYIHSIIRFSFSISSLLIDFGTLSPANPVTRNNNLTIKNGSAYGYSVTAFENHQLIVPVNGTLIPDTTCDAGNCSEAIPAAWTSSLTYGFGYRCDNVTGSDCQSGFATDFYRQFPDLSKNEIAYPVMTGRNVGRNKQTQITYRVNISAVQPPGLYTNVITYIATPSF